MKRSLALAAAVLCASCAAHLKLPDQGGPAWRELQSDAFILRTDLDEPAARELLDSLTQLRAGMVRALLGLLQAPPPLQRVVVVGLRSFKEVQDLAPLRAVGAGRGFGTIRTISVAGFRTHDRFGRSMVAVAADQRLRDSDAAHFAVRASAIWSLRRAPPWLHLGLRALAKGLWIDLLGGGVHVEDSLDGALGRAVGTAAPTAKVLAASAADLESAALADGAVLVTERLEANHRQQLADFIGRLAGGEDEAAAFASAFGGLTAEQIDAEIRARPPKTAWLGGVELPAAAKVEATSRAMSAAEVHALIADLAMALPQMAVDADWRQVATQHRQVALQLDPNLGAALVPLALDFAPAERLAQLRALLARKPDDAEALRELAYASGVPAEEQLQSLRREVELVPDDLGALLGLVRLAAPQEPALALQALDRLALFERHTPWMLVRRAAALRKLGRCEEAERAAAAAKRQGSKDKSLDEPCGNKT